MSAVPDRIFANAHDQSVCVFSDPNEEEPCHTFRAPRVVTEDETEAWILGFAMTGDIEDELGQYKNHCGTVTHEVALQWVRDKSKITDGVANVFFRWARNCVYLANFGK